MSVFEISVRRPVATTMFYLAVIMLGVVSLTRLPVDLLPDVSYPKLTIWTSYPNVPPIEVEELITVPIEEAVSTVPRIRRVSSVSKEGVSLVTLEFLWARTWTSPRSTCGRSWTTCAGRCRRKPNVPRFCASTPAPCR